MVILGVDAVKEIVDDKVSQLTVQTEDLIGKIEEKAAEDNNRNTVEY